MTSEKISGPIWGYTAINEKPLNKLQLPPSQKSIWSMGRIGHWIGSKSTFMLMKENKRLGNKTNLSNINRALKVKNCKIDI